MIALPQLAVIVGAACGALVSYAARRCSPSGHAPASPPAKPRLKAVFMSVDAEVFVIGAGPAGLTAAYCLTKETPSVVVIEKDPVYVGGISRTVHYKDFLFDIGGHRFFSKSKEVVDLWQEILPDDFIERPRLSRIYYNGKFFSYPLKAFEALPNLGIFTSAACMLSYAYAKAFPIASRAPSTNGCATSSASGCSRSSSRPTPRRCGACPATRFPPTGPRSASRASIC